MTAETYTVRVAKDYLVFSAGHFITYRGGDCERLHGHNYRAAVEVDAPLGPDHYAFDFIALRDETRALCDELDHRMLLPAESELIRVEERDGSVVARYKDRTWMFPRDECVLLPLANTTAELLGRYLGQRLLGVLRTKHGFTPLRLRVEVEECFGQAATYSWSAS
ncbi:MAG: 6-carboxytetrahydropterin synthase [Gemmataceae bacterium]